MKYIAKENVGKYKKGDSVPSAQAEEWIKRFVTAPVEAVGKATEVVKAPVKEKVVEKSSNNSLLDDYLARNKNVVKKNILSDELDEATLKSLLEKEISDKNRKAVVAAIKSKLA